MPQPGPFGGAFDQPGDVGQHRLAILALDRAQHRRQRRERIVGHLRRRPGQPPQQRGLARVGQPDQPDVGQQLQPQLDPARLARRSPSRRTAAPAASRSRSACSRARHAPRERPRPAARPRPGRSRSRRRPPPGSRPAPESPAPPPEPHAGWTLPRAAPARPGSACSPAAPPDPAATHRKPARRPRRARHPRHRARPWAHAPPAESSHTRSRRPHPQPRSSPCRTSS